jgi:hypothetical protein
MACKHWQQIFSAGGFPCNLKKIENFYVPE